jgi:glutathione peroxidase-family protein
MPFWSSKSDEPMAASAHEFNAVMNNGESQSLSVYAGHPLIVVNVASQ